MVNRNPELVHHAQALIQKSTRLVEHYLDSGIVIDLAAFYGSLARWIAGTEHLRPDHPFTACSDGDLYLKPHKLPRGREELNEFKDRLDTLVAWDNEYNGISVAVDYLPTDPDDKTSYRLFKKQIDRDYLPLYQHGQFLKVDL